MKKAFNKIYDSQGCQLVLAALITSVCFAILYSTHSVFWGMIDDNEAMKALSGFYTGEPTFSAPFVNVVLGFFFKWLYSITTAVSWYSVFHFAVIFISITSIFRFILLCFNKKNISAAIPIVICIVLFFAAFMHLTLYVLFTTNATLIGCGAIALLFVGNANSNRKLKYLDYIISGMFIILAFIIRFESGIAVFCFWAISIVYIIAISINSGKKKATKKVVKLVLLLIISFVLGFV